MQTNFKCIHNEFNVYNFNYMYKFSTLIDHDNEYITDIEKILIYSY